MKKIDKDILFLNKAIGVYPNDVRQLLVKHGAKNTSPTVKNVLVFSRSNPDFKTAFGNRIAELANRDQIRYNLEGNDPLTPEPPLPDSSGKGKTKLTGGEITTIVTDLGKSISSMFGNIFGQSATNNYNYGAQAPTSGSNTTTILVIVGVVVVLGIVVFFAFKK